MQVTRNADAAPTTASPAVLYNAMQHAREWLAGETCKRTLDYFTSSTARTAGHAARRTRASCGSSACRNPDGYEYTFTPGNRLWRKNLRDNNGDGVHRQNGDGVDPNRNFPVNWGLDDEGSSPDPASETYRGPAPASEPETQAMLKLWDMVAFEFQKNDHTAAELLLYPQGWQQYTPAADDPIFTALAGDDEDPAIHGLRPGPRRRALHHQRRHARHGVQPQGHPRLHARGLRAAQDTTVSGLRVRGRPRARSQAEFQRHLRVLARPRRVGGRSGATRTRTSATRVEDFYVDSFA